MFSPKLSKPATKTTPATPHAHAGELSFAHPRRFNRRPAKAVQAASEQQNATRLFQFDLSAVSIFPPDREQAFGEISGRLGINAHTVRLRSDAQAVHFLNSHRAAAATMDNATILVRPEYGRNNFVLSHELVHIAQLRRGLSSSMQQSENAAHHNANLLLHGYAPESIGGAAPVPLFLHFTGGAFDQALDNASIPEPVLKRLNTSAAFKQIVMTLDAHYVWLSNKALTTHDYLGVENGVLQSGVHKGKRLLSIQGGGVGGSFNPWQALGNHLNADVIVITGGTDNPELVRTIAHEATHAFRFVTGKAAPRDPLLGDDKPEKVEAAIQAGVTEEQETRKKEISITQGISPKGSKERTALEQDVAAGYLSRPQIERDIAPGIGLTYLENSGFGALLQEAKATEKLSDERTADIQDQIENGPMKKFPMIKDKHGVDEPSQYALIYKNRQIAIASWQAFNQRFADRLTSGEAQKEKERLLQENARVLLDGRIQYSPLHETEGK